MFHHAFSPSIPKNSKKPFSYWVIHGPTLTPIRVNVGLGGRVTLDIVPHPLAETAYINPDPGAAKPNPDLLFSELRRANPRLIRGSERFYTREDANVPEYLIVFDINGENPAIARTQDPQFVNYINEPEEMLSVEHAYSRTVNDNLPAMGWCYWWQDGQAAYERLAPAIIGED